jgi:three-Cys-motif partner protein
MPTARFGGPWTEEKLKRLSKYLAGFLTALKKQRFEKIYFDAFAGSGSRIAVALDERPKLALEITKLSEIAHGSARRALGAELKFDRYVFVEKDRDRFAKLRTELSAEYPSLVGKMDFVFGDANSAILRTCAAVNPSAGGRPRMVMFLDPYGMQVNWSSIEAVAATRAIDLWYLVPTGMGLKRVMPKGEPPMKAWRDRIALMTGDSNWERAFYRKSPQSNLFGDDEIEMCASIEDIERYFVSRLRKVFPGVAENPLRLVNSRNYPMYLLTFACGNPSLKAQTLALKLARAVLKN